MTALSCIELQPEELRAWQWAAIGTGMEEGASATTGLLLASYAKFDSTLAPPLESKNQGQRYTGQWVDAQKLTRYAD